MGNKFTNSMLAILVVTVVAVGGVLIFGNPFQAEEEAPTGAEGAGSTAVPASESGKIASFKLSVKDSQDNPARYTGTGYCWDKTTPNTLIGGGSVSLSASAGTTVSPVNLNQELECIAFDSTHYGMKESKKVLLQADQLILSSLNATTAQSDLTFLFFEDGSVESGHASITISASATDTFDRWQVKANVADKGFNLKQICLGSNSSVSEITEISLAGLTSSSIIPYRYRNTMDFCFDLAEATYIEDFNTMDFGVIKITTGDAFAFDELINVTLIDEAYYESVLGGIKLGTQADDPTPDDTGAVDIFTNFTVVKG